jgi:hypothetical protein
MQPSRPKAQQVQPSVAPEVEAAKLNEDARAEANAGHLEKSLLLFQRAYELDQRASYLLNVGFIESRLGRCLDARRTVQRVVATWPNDPVVKKAKSFLERMGPCK